MEPEICFSLLKPETPTFKESYEGKTAFSERPPAPERPFFIPKREISMVNERKKQLNFSNKPESDHLRGGDVAFKSSFRF